MIERDVVGKKVSETSQVIADGYRRNVSKLNTDEQNRTAEQCAIAASNTGYFILQSLGFSTEEIKRIHAHGQTPWG